MRRERSTQSASRLKCWRACPAQSDFRRYTTGFDVCSRSPVRFSAVTRPGFGVVCTRYVLLLRFLPRFFVRQAAEGLARDAYARAVALCVAGSDAGPQALLDKRVVGVGSTAAVVSSSPKRGQHRCFVCTQTKDGFAHYELNMAKGRRDRRGARVLSRRDIGSVSTVVFATDLRRHARHTYVEVW